MNPLARMLLKAFDAPGSLSRPGGELALRSVSDTAELRPISEEVVARGWLRSSRSVDTYGCPDEGRLAVAEPLDVTLYTREGCHLCEEAKLQIAPLLDRAGARLLEIDIDNDPLLRDRYNVDVPVIFLG